MSAMYSMTGYAISEVQKESYQIRIEMKSVNNRYLEIIFHCPSFLYAFEGQMRTLIKNAISRGKIEISIYIEEFNCDYQIIPNLRLAEEYNKALTKLVSHLALKDNSIRLDHFLRAEGILNITEERPVEAIWELVKPEFNACIEKLIQDRVRDGESTKKDLLHQAQWIKKNLEEIEVLAENFADELIQKIKDRMLELIGNQAYDENRLLTEAALLSTKMDINEEIQRLRSHTLNLMDVLDKDPHPGRILEFTSQEMLRESTTIGAKAANMEISQRVIHIKTAIEKIREQIRNIE